MSNIQTYRKPFEIRREMAKLPEVKKSLGSVGMGIYLATTGRPVSDYSERELATELKNALRWICKDVGFRDASEADSQYIVVRTMSLLLRYYATFSLDDFRMAFELSLTGELDEFLPKRADGQPDRGHYQNFNAEYICKILNAYKAKRGWIMKQAREAVPKSKDEPEVDKEELMQETKRACIEAFEMFRDTGSLPEMSPVAEMLCYETLREAGLAESVKVSDDEKQRVLQRTIAYYASRGLTGRTRILKQEGIKDREVEQDAYFLARRKRIQETFERMKEQGINIRDYVRESITD